jgi:hypothetical protein
LDDFIFGVDFDTGEVVFHTGDRAAIESWRDPLGFECAPYKARVVVFRTPSGLPFALDLDLCYSNGTLH